MAPKRPPPLDDPPSASSDEEDEVETDDDQDQDQDQEIITQNTTQQSESDSESQQESESEQDSEPDETQTQTPKSSSIFEFESDIKSPSVSNFAIKPSKKIKSFSTPDSKKLKLSTNGEEKKSLSVIKRVWSEDDELMLLQGFIDYQSKKGCSPLSDMDGFYRFSMDFLPGNASKSQLYEKVRRLKKKFRVNEERVGVSGEDGVFVKPHERKLFEVSKKIWGVDGCETVGNVAGSSVKSKARSVQVKAKGKGDGKAAAIVVKAEDLGDDEEMVEEEKGFETLYPYWNAGLNMGDSSASLHFPTGIIGLFRYDLSLIEEAKAKEMNEKWKAIFEKEAVLQKKKIALLNKVSTL